MPTIMSHAAIPLAIGLGLGTGLIPPRLLLAGVAASILPDADVLAFRLGIQYEHALGHRGFSHALLTAALTGAFTMLLAPWLKSARTTACWFIALCMASHGLLDMLTDGGLGVALFWPWTQARFFFPWHGIEVSPLRLDLILGARGIEVALSELRWIWLPAIASCALLHFGIKPRLKHGA